MESQNEISEKISRITAVIRENYPELASHLNEMPEFANGEAPDTDALSQYYDNLLAVFRNYVAEHQLQNANRVYKDHHL